MRRRLRAYLRIRNRYLLVVDLVSMFIAAILAMELRLESWDAVGTNLVPLVAYGLLAAVIRVVTFIRTGLYTEYWPYASTQELKTLLKAVWYAALAVLVAFFVLLLPAGVIPEGFPRSVPFIDILLTSILVGGLRLIIRLGSSHDMDAGERHNLRPVVIAGAGVAGAMVVKELRSNPQLGLFPVAYLDDDLRKRMSRIHGVQVLGGLNDLPRICKEMKAGMVVIAMPNVPGKVVRDVLQLARDNGVETKTIPGLFEILRGTAKVVQLRSIQLEDLLRRGTVTADTREVSDRLRGKRILVTGAGGSIGSELCRQIKGLGPSELTLVGHGENSIFKIAAELKEQAGASFPIHTVIADVRELHRLEQVFRALKPEIVFHAAAHKHVPLMELNPADAVTNNVLGTWNMATLAADHGVERFVLVSTDKAVNPTSIMGATKRVAELIVHDVARRTKRELVIVRFGNVLGSRGSVIPVLQQQIEAGGPVTVTHPEVKRYFMTIPEAVHLVLQSGVMGRGGEVFVLDMGEQLRIVDLARDLIRLSGFQEGKDINIVYTGLRPGEKMEEELTLESETFEPTAHAKVKAFRWNGGNGNGQRADEARRVFHEALAKLLECAKSGDEGCIEKLLGEVVPEFSRARGDGPAQPGADGEKKRPPHLEKGKAPIEEAMEREEAGLGRAEEGTA
jgi:FlaA1/EpsC-like NDP-sugar epimerase